MKSSWTVARRDIRALFDHPTGYILLIVFLAINNFLFFRSVFLIGVASVRPMMDLLPWLFLFFIPAATMRAIAEDARAGTVEIVLAQPISELSYLLGKYIAQVVFIWFGLALTLVIPLGLSLGADLQLGVIFAQFTGAALLGGGLVAVGVWSSSLTRNQITAFIIGVAVMFLLVLVGLDSLVVGLPPTLGAVAARLGVLSHFANIGRGVIDLRDVVYFVTMAATFLSLAYLAIMGRKLAAAGEARRRLRLGVAMSIAILVVINLFGSKIGGRLDLTPGNAYTLSDATGEMVRNLDDIVTLKLYASKGLPPEIQLLRRDVDDLLRDFRGAANGRIRLVERDPDDGEEVAREAQSAGVPPVQFNVVGQSELQVKQGYLGLVIQYADGSETIPFIRQADDLEYRIASFIKSLTTSAKASVGILTTASDPAQQSTFNSLTSSLRESYNVTNLSWPLDSTFNDDFKAVVILGDPDSLTDSDVTTLRAFLAAGGGAFVAARGMTVSLQQQQIAFADDLALNRLIEPFGVSINSDMVYDLASNERVAFNSQMGRVMMSYPFWTRPLSTRSAVLNQDLEGAFMPWVSSVDTAAAMEGTVTPLFISSPAGGVESGTSFLSPNRQFPRDSLSPRVVAVQVNTLESDSAAVRGRLIVTGNSDFASDQYSRNAPENILFVLNSIDWLAQDEALIAIRSKNRRPPQLAFTSELTRDMVKYANLAGVPLLLMVVASLRMVRRRNMMGRTFVRGDDA